MMMTMLSRHGGWRCWAWGTRKTKMVETVRVLPIFFLPYLALRAIPLSSIFPLYHVVFTFSSVSPLVAIIFFSYSILFCPLIDPSIPLLCPLFYYYLFTDSVLHLLPSSPPPLLCSLPLSSPPLLSYIFSSSLLSSLLTR